MGRGRIPPVDRVDRCRSHRSCRIRASITPALLLVGLIGLPSSACAQSPWEARIVMRAGQEFHRSDVLPDDAVNSSSRFDDATFFGLAVTLWWRRAWGLRLSADRLETKVSGPRITRGRFEDEDEIRTLQLQVLRTFRSAESFRPHLGVGGGLREYRIEEGLRSGDVVGALVPEGRQVQPALSALLGLSYERDVLRVRFEIEGLLSRIHRRDSTVRQTHLRPSLSVGIPFPGTDPGD